MSTGASKPSARSAEARMVTLNLSAKELVFLQKVTRQEYHFITDDEQQARLRLRDKLVEAAFDQERGRVVLNLTRDELPLPHQGRPRELLLHRPRGEGGPPRPRRQAAQDRGVGLRGDHPRGLTLPCAPSSSGRPVTSTTARARSCARSPAPTPTA